MLVGKIGEIAIELRPEEKHESGQWVFGSLSLLLAGHAYFSELRGLTLTAIINSLANGFEPYEIGRLHEPESLFMLGCLFNGYLSKEHVPDVTQEMWSAPDGPVKEFVDRYFEMLDRIKKTFGAKNELQLTYELSDRGAKAFCFQYMGEELVVIKEHESAPVVLHRIPLGSCRRFAEAVRSVQAI
jgi:hypothetical protein